MIDEVWLIVGVGSVLDFLFSKQTSDTWRGRGGPTDRVDCNYNVGSGGYGIMRRAETNNELVT